MKAWLPKEANSPSPGGEVQAPSAGKRSPRGVLGPQPGACKALRQAWGPHPGPVICDLPLISHKFHVFALPPYDLEF